MSQLKSSALFGAALLPFVVGCDGGASQSVGKETCAAVETYAGISNLLFDRAREQLDDDVIILNDMEKAMRLKVDQPLATRVLDDIDRVDCEGRAVIEIPSPLRDAFGNHKEIAAEIGYSVQRAADGKGYKYELGGEGPMIDALLAAVVEKTMSKEKNSTVSSPAESKMAVNAAAEIPKSELRALAGAGVSGSTVDGLATVRSFYAALGNGDGFAANSLILPDKRKNPNYRAAALTAFYGDMAEPLEIIDIQRLNASEYIVDYYWRKDSKECNGRSAVSVIWQGQQAFIGNIRTINGC